MWPFYGSKYTIYFFGHFDLCPVSIQLNIAPFTFIASGITNHAISYLEDI